ncbi:alpha/beta fold hydrolase [Streptomyces sp. NPDC090026]|uniref:alpha/beta fold hydrolase n=1 Tax=Streptomyces sp. NPDC090026 TaxID=3365923 RepID=UPI00381F07BE
MSRPTRGTEAPPVADRELTAVSADGSRIHVEIHGPQGAPAVVLAHGWTCSTRFWDAQIRALAGDHRVIAYDQRGHGRSPLGPAGTDRLADDLEAVLSTALAPEERAVLAGHSMGGMTIMAAAARPVFRARAAAVLLCSTGSARLTDEARVVPLRPGRLRGRLTRAVLGARAPLGPVTPVSRRILKYATMGPASSPERVDACARIVHACPRDARVAWSEVLAGLDLDQGVRALDVPAVVVAGTVDRLTPLVHAKRLALDLPRCVELVELAGMGHMTPVEAPEAVTAKIRELVGTHGSTRAGTDGSAKIGTDGSTKAGTDGSSTKAGTHGSAKIGTQGSSTKEEPA